MLGVYFSFMSIDFITFLKRIPIQTHIVLMIAAVLISYWLNDNDTIYNITDLFLQTAVFAITAYMIENHRWRESKYLVSSVFFVFAVHRLFSASLMTVSTYLVPSIGNDYCLYLYYLLMVILTLIVSLAVYQFSIRFLPSVTHVLNGRR